MPATVELLENNRVIYFNYTEPWTIDELNGVIEGAHTYMKNATQKLHMIANVRNIHSVPPQIFRTRNAPILSHVNSGNMAVVGAPSLVKTLSEALFRIASYKKSVFFNTEDEAWNYIRKLITSEVATNTAAD